MTEQTNADLIAELRGFAAGSESARASLMRDAADALEAADQRATEYAAVVEKVRAWADRNKGTGYGTGTGASALEVLDILATAPADALEASERRAAYPEAERSFLSVEWERIAKSAIAGREDAEKDRDAAREEVGYEKRMREFVSGERDRFIDLKRAVEQERNQLAAVIEQVEDYVTRHYLDTRFGDEVLPMLATAPADALREHDAKVRAEEREKAAQIAEDAPGTEASGYYAGDHQMGYQEAQSWIAARIREQGKEQGS